MVKKLLVMQEPQEMWVQSLGQEDPLEEDMATHSNILAWKTPQTEKPGRLLFMGLQRIRHDDARTHIHINTLPLCTRTRRKILNIWKL